MAASVPIERNSRLSLANAKNKAARNYLALELGFLEKEKKTALRILQNEKRAFKSKYSKTHAIEDPLTNLPQEVLSKLYYNKEEKLKDQILLGFGDSGNSSNNNCLNFEQIRNLLFTDDEIDIEKILCLHMVAAHRTESLTPPKKKLLAHMCKIHSPVERLLERSKRRNIHHEQKLTSMLPIYTIESMEFGTTHAQGSRDLINDGRLAARILLNERIRELVNTVLTALKQSNPEKNYEIFEKASDISFLKKMFSSKKILRFLEDLNQIPFVCSCDSFILTAPFRAKSIQLEIRTISGNLEYLVKKIRQNVLQIPTRQPKLAEDDLDEGNEAVKDRLSCNSFRFRPRMNTKSKGNTLEEIEFLYADKTERISQDKKIVRHKNKNFIRQNIHGLANVRRIEYDSDNEDEYFLHKRILPPNTSMRRSSQRSERKGVVDRPNIQPIDLSLVVLMSDKDKEDDNEEDEGSPRNSARSSFYKMSKHSEEERKSSDVSNTSSKLDRRKSGICDSSNIKIHLKQTTCPACMEKYKIPLPTPKTPRVKPSAVLPLVLGENSLLKTNSRNRISMLISKETFKLESYERRFTLADEKSRKKSFNKKELESISSEEFSLSPLELAKIEQEIKEKETQKKLEKFLSS